MNNTEMANTIDALAKACESISKLLFEETQRRVELGERYADLLTRFNERTADQDRRVESEPCDIELFVGRKR